MGRTRYRSIDEDFTGAVALVLVTGRPIAQAAGELGVNVRPDSGRVSHQVTTSILIGDPRRRGAAPEPVDLRCLKLEMADGLPAGVRAMQPSYARNRHKQVTFPSVQAGQKRVVQPYEYTASASSDHARSRLGA